jgi:hypothetical protein
MMENIAAPGRGQDAGRAIRKSEHESTLIHTNQNAVLLPSISDD